MLSALARALGVSTDELLGEGAMTMTLSEDIAALCAAIDAGDDSALPILADALGE